MVGPLLFGILLALGVMIGFVGFGRFVDVKDPVDARLQQFGGTFEPAADAGGLKRRALPLISRILNGFGLGPRLARGLMQADLPLTAAELVLIVFLLACLGFAVGALRFGILLGVGMAALLGILPIAYVETRRGRRKLKLTEQLPDVLTLLIGALRAGLGLSQAMDMLAKQAPQPSATEFGRATRAVSLGVSIQRALNDMAGRIGSDDLDLVVTAINVQYEMGGNLAQTLDIIGETVRDRIRIQREIRVATAQQRFTGYALALLPVILGIITYMMRPEYMRVMFEPAWIWLPIAAAVMMLAGFLVIRKILAIEV